MARTKMKRDEVHYVALAFSDLPAPADTAAGRGLDVADRRVLAAVADARARSPTTRGASYLQSSALALKGLSYAPTGALLAAATTSLPETPGGERNWDYRYTWIRDSTFALWGLYTLGFDREANDFFYFIHDVCRDNPNDLQIMYGVGGERHLEEGTLDHLTGYDDARPVRIGNGAYNQQQHDVWGALLDSIYLHTRSREQMPEELWPIVIAQVEQAAAHWQAPDRGIWEVRGEPQHFTASKIMCWVAMDRGVRLARLHDSPRHRRQVAGDRRRDPRRHPGQRRRRARRAGAAVRLRRPGRLAAAGPAGPVPAAGRPADPGHRAGHRRRAHPRGPGAALPGGGDRRRAGRRGGHLHHLLVLAGLGAGGDRRGRAGPGRCASGCCRTPPRSACTPRSSTRSPAGTWATSRRRSPTWR